MWLPHLSTDRLRPADAPHEPLVLVEKIAGAMRIVAVDRAAAALGLAPGLSLADARARFTGLAAVPADHHADALLLDKLAGLAERFTPSVALDPPYGLLLDIGGSAHLFGGEAGARAQVRGLLRRLGFGVRAAVAGTPDAARALARYGRVRVVPAGMDAAFVRPLPVAALGIDAATVLALARAGLKSIGDIADRPPTALAARFGEGLTRRLRRTLGQEDARLVTLRPVPDLVVEQVFPEPMTHLDGLNAVLAQLIAQAARLLGDQGAGGRAFEASFFRSDGAVRRVRVETGRPSRDPERIARLFHERLEAIADPLDPGFGFDCMRLAVPAAEPLSPAQASLDGEHADELAVDALIDRLVARLGRDRVLGFAPRDTHDPARAARHVRAVAPMAGAVSPWSKPEKGAPPARPLRLFSRPQPVDTLAEVPDGPPRRFRWRRALHEVRLAEGPERIAPEWWRGEGGTTRDYYRVEDRAGRRYWLFREGVYGGPEMPRWYLHGLFA